MEGKPRYRLFILINQEKPNKVCKINEAKLSR